MLGYEKESEAIDKMNEFKKKKRLQFCPLIKKECNRYCICFEEEMVYKVSDLYYFSSPICNNLSFAGESIVIKTKR